METVELKTRKKSKKELNDLRLKEDKVKANAGKLADESVVVIPSDIEIMFVGRGCDRSMKNNVRMENNLAAYLKTYKDADPAILQRLKDYANIYQKDFELNKKRLEDISQNHPVCASLSRIRGLTNYQIALLMSYIKDINRFDTPSKLVVYCGVGVKYGMKVQKKNLHLINDQKHKEYNGKAKDWKDFGFNTQISGRLDVIAEGLIRADGYMKHIYDVQKKRLIERAITNKECAIFDGTDDAGNLLEETKATIMADEYLNDEQKEEKIKKLKDKREVGRYYMIGRLNQSVEGWADRNATHRMSRTLIHLLYTEWRTYLGLPVRNPFAIDYLGHNSFIKLDDVLNYETNQPKKIRKKRKSI